MCSRVDKAGARDSGRLMVSSIRKIEMLGSDKSAKFITIYISIDPSSYPMRKRR